MSTSATTGSRSDVLNTCASKPSSACAGCGRSVSTSTSCTGSTPQSRSPTRSAPCGFSRPRGRSATSACPKSVSARLPKPRPSPPSAASRTATTSPTAALATSCATANSTASPLSHGSRSAPSQQPPPPGRWPLWPAGSAPPPPRSPWPGCCGTPQAWCRSPAPPPARTWRKTSPPRRSPSAPTITPSSPRPEPALWAGPATRSLSATICRARGLPSPQCHDALRIGRGSEEAVHAMHVAAGNIEGLMMVADGLLVRSFQEAIDLAVGVVVELNLPHAELVGGAVPRSLGYLVDGILRQLQILMEVHEPWHVCPPRPAPSHYCAPITRVLSIPRIQRVTAPGRHPPPRSSSSASASGPLTAGERSMPRLQH